MPSKLEASADANAQMLASTQNLTRQMVVGSAWMIAMRWGIRGIGLISTIVLARLLTPLDFGLVAKAMLFVGLLEVMAQTGQRLAIIRHPNPDRAHYDTAWTLSLLVNGILAIALVFIAPLASVLLREPDAVPLIQVLALRTLLNGMENIGTVDFRRYMQFNKDFQYNVATKFISFLVTMVLAFIYRNYIALVGGIVIGQFILVITSYVVCKYRPRLSLEKAAEIWTYSFWVLLSSIGAYLLNRLDQWIISTRVSNSLMGQYTVGSELAQLPTTEVVSPAMRALYPAYSKLWATSLEAMTEALKRNLQLLAIICFSLGIGVACVARDLSLVLLGPQWTRASEFIVYLALAAALNGFNSCAGTVLNVTGHVRMASALSWIRVALTVPCLLIGFYLQDALGVSKALLVAAVLFTPTFYFELLKVIPITVRELISIIWRPLLSSTLMAVALWFVPRLGVYLPIQLVAEIGAGAIVFLVSQYTLWLTAGRPDTIERTVLLMLRKRMTFKA